MPPSDYFRHLESTETTKRPTLGEAAREGPRGFLRILGPGITTGAADDDPSAVGTYAQAGAQAGYLMLWTGLFLLPLMAAVQELVQRIALQTGMGLGVNLRRKFPAWLVAIAAGLLVVANVIVLGADLQAVAAGVALLTGGRVATRWVILPVAVLIVAFQLWGRYETLFRALKWLALALFAYLLAAVLARPPAGTVLVATFVPHVQFSGATLLTFVAVVGTTLSPYLFFWQPAEEIDDERAQGKVSVEQRAGVSRRELSAARTDTFAGMFFSQLVAYCIILTGAAVLHAHGKTDIQTAADAAKMLSPVVGPVAFILFSVGFIGTGLLAVPVLSASSAYAINEVALIPASLADRPRYQPTFYGIIVTATSLGVAMNLIGLNVIQALIIASALSGVAAVPLLVLMTLFGSDRSYMGDRTSGWLSRSLTWISAGGMAVAASALVITPLLHVK